ncbi:hypothetical protein E4O81_11725, partial [Neisseria meningitidis]|nr:hypothetical protein [Neisseria meningitidis]
HIGWRLWLLFTINVPFLIGMAGMMIGRHDWMIPVKTVLKGSKIVALRNENGSYNCSFLRRRQNPIVALRNENGSYNDLPIA